MRVLFVVAAIMIFAAGCTTKTAVIKTHPSDDAPRPVTQSKVIIANNHLEQGKRLYFQAKYDQATKHFIRAIANNREDWEAYYFLGLTQQKKKRYDRSIGSFNNSLKYAPQDRLLRAKINYALGLSWENEGYLIEAQEKFKLAQRLDPTYKQAKAASKRIELKTAKAEKQSGKKDKDKAY